MGVFDKKFCGICGEKIGILGNRKLEDDNLCKKCAALLSPFMTERRKTTLAEIKQHLAYREANKAEVAKFNVSKELGEDTLVLIDETAGKFIVTSSKKWQFENPDVIEISQVSGFDLDIKETKDEIKMKDSEGKMISFDPPRYDIEYDFYFTIKVKSTWFSEIKFKLNRNRIEAQNPARYMEYDKKATAIKEALNPNSDTSKGC